MLRMESLLVLSLNHQLHLESLIFLYPAQRASFKGYYPGFTKAAFADTRHWCWITLKAHSRNTASTIKVRSTDPRDTPLINFNYFDTGNTASGAATKDVQAVYEGIQYSRKAFKTLVPLDGLFTEVWPEQIVSTEAQTKEYIKNEAWGYHDSCTCPIGKD